MSTQNALKLLFELRAVLDRLGEEDQTLKEALAHDIDRAMRLTDACVAELTEDELAGAEVEEADNQ
ncbi:MAG: hypothetical protein ABSE62_00380 [Chthoniobacteraceae bacterium]